MVRVRDGQDDTSRGSGHDAPHADPWLALDAPSAADDRVLVTFLGGLGEIGRNMAAIEVGGKIAVIDVGVFFPNPEHLGVDLILADWSVLRDRADDVVAVLLTHGHEDHIGGLPYFLRDFPDVTVYGTRLTVAFCEAKLEEWDEITPPEFVVVEPGERFDAQGFDVEAIGVSHSIPDSCGFAIRTPHGIVVHSGDFKMDQTPVDGHGTDLAALARVGDERVALLLADSTNADRPGHVKSERTVGRSLREVIAGIDGLLVVASFASHVHRIQQVVDAAAAQGRRPVFVGRSMVRNMAIAAELGYLEVDMSRAVELNDVDRHDRSELVIISTGSQGEPYSALSLMASGDHRRIQVGEGDTIVLASSLIPGNEHAVFKAINGLARRGATVIHQGIADVHVSGHASREDLVLYHNLLEPEHVVPVHGEYRHLKAHREIAVETGCPPENALLCSDGDVVALVDGRAWKAGTVPYGRVYLDGNIDDVGPKLLRDRARLAGDGVCVCVVTVDPSRGTKAGDTIVTQKGVVFSEEADPILAEATRRVDAELERLESKKFTDERALQQHVTQALGRFWRHEIGRRPVILPIVLDA